MHACKDAANQVSIDIHQVSKLRLSFMSDLPDFYHLRKLSLGSYVLSNMSSYVEGLRVEL